MRRRSVVSGAVSDIVSPTVGSGSFRKQGSGVKNWKLRNYIITADCDLFYSDPQNGDIKGQMKVDNVELSHGPKEYIKASGAPYVTGFPMTIKSIADNRILEVVLDDDIAAKALVDLLGKVSKGTSVEVGS